MHNRVIKILLIITLPLTGAYFFYQKASFYYEEPNALRDKMEYLYNGGGRHDMLFMGSSRVLRHIDPRVMDSICHVDSYNLGVEGMLITELRMMLRVCIRKGKAPRVLVLNVDPSSLQTEQAYYDFTALMDYAARDTVVYNAMAAVQDLYKHRWKYPVYRLQKYFAINDGFKADVFFEGTEKFHRRMETLWDNASLAPYYKGFRPRCTGYRDGITPPFHVPWQEKGFELLRDIIHTCREHGIRLVLVTAPMYKGYDRIFLNADSLAGRIESLANEENVPYFNMIRDSLSMDKQNFINPDHFNCRGAKLYSVELATLLSRLKNR